MRKKPLITLLFLVLGYSAAAQFDPEGGKPGSLAIPAESHRIESWVHQVEIKRGYQNITDTSLGKVTQGITENATGKADRSTVSAGDAGQILVTFDRALNDNPGPDFAVFENGFSWAKGFFYELAFVEVSKDGQRFVRFPAESLTDTAIQLNNEAAMFSENLHNLAGKHQALFGTPFDLSELADSFNGDAGGIKYLRLKDVVGCVDCPYKSYDSKGRVINDPFPTPFENSGFELDAVAILNNQISNTEQLQEALYLNIPNPLPVNYQVNYTLDTEVIWVITNVSGQIIKEGNGTQLCFSLGQPGVYVVQLQQGEEQTFVKLWVH